MDCWGGGGLRADCIENGLSTAASSGGAGNAVARGPRSGHQTNEAIDRQLDASDVVGNVVVNLIADRDADGKVVAFTHLASFFLKRKWLYIPLTGPEFITLLGRELVASRVSELSTDREGGVEPKRTPHTHTGVTTGLSRLTRSSEVFPHLNQRNVGVRKPTALTGLIAHIVINPIKGNAGGIWESNMIDRGNTKQAGGVVCGKVEPGN